MLANILKSNLGVASLQVILLLMVISISCSDSIEITGVVDVPGVNPLMISINFSSGAPSDTYVEYWPIGEDIRIKSWVSKNKIDHSITLIGLQSETKYDYIVHIKSDNKKVASKVNNFTTSRLPEHLPEFTVVKGNEKSFDGFLMLRKMDNPGTQLIINSRGTIVWYQVSDTVVFRPFSLTTSSSYLALKGSDEIVEMNFSGDTILHLTRGVNDFNKNLHHEIFRDKKHQIVALTKEEKLFDLTEFGGSNNEVVVGDGIMIIDSLGNSIWNWNIFDVVEVYPSLDLFKFRKDWSHANALSKDLDGNFLISFRNFNQIWKVDAIDGHIIWKLGENGDFQLNENEYFKYQHAVHVNPSGDIMFFDNIHNRKNSRAIAFNIDIENNKADSKLVVNLPDSLYSFKQGSAYFIDSDKLLFCSSMSKKIAVTNLEGEILWQINSEQSFYRAVYINDKDYFQQFTTRHQR